MATAPGINYFSFGGEPTVKAASGIFPQTNSANILCLNSAIGSPTSGNFYAFNDQTQTGICQVPTGKTLHVFGFYFNSGSNSTRTTLQFGYATSSFSHNTASGSPPTGAVYYGPTSTLSDSFGVYLPATANITVWHERKMSFPALSYPFWRSTEGTNAIGMLLFGVLI